jgi:hypothetical protein
MSLAKKITPADEYFVSLVTEGHMKNMDAYFLAFPHYKERSEGTNTSEMSLYLRTPKISGMIEDYRAQIRETTTMTVEYMLAKLKEFVEDPAVRTNDRIKSMELAGKFQGAFTQKIKHEGNIGVSHDISPDMAAAIDDLLR